MRFLYDTYENIAKKVKNENRYIVIYGAGMIGQTLLPYIISKYELCDNLLFYIDGDTRKQNSFISIGEKRYAINGQEYLRRLPVDTIVLVTNSNYSPIVEMLDEIEELHSTEGYIIPILQILNMRSSRKQYTAETGMEQLIPKKIHYCWFSRKAMPEYLLMCIESWRKFCPDYEIVRWDEDNYDVEKNLYMKQAYEAKKWGFVPDIARLDILYEHGGIYLDTDVELVKSLDELLYLPAFTGVEKWGNINMGGGSGAMPHHPLIKRMLDFRSNEKFVLEDGNLNLMTCGFYETKPLIELGMEPNNTVQKIGNMVIYSSEYFHPYDYMSGELTMTENTFSIHHFNGGWLDEKHMSERNKTRKQFKEMLERMQVLADDEYDDNHSDRADIQCNRVFGKMS